MTAGTWRYTSPFQSKVVSDFFSESLDLSRYQDVPGELRHGVDLVAASLQFSLAPDVAASLIVGTANPDHLLADHAALRAAIPRAFWDELRAAGIIHPDAAVPGRPGADGQLAKAAALP